MAPHASDGQGSHPPLPTGSPPHSEDPPLHQGPRIALTLQQCCLVSAEPHMPHVLMEKGDMTLGEFDQHLKGRADFIKGMKKDSSAERKVRVTEQRQRGQTWGGSGHWPHWASEKPEPRGGVGGLAGGRTASR